jgi:hypothetical protein
MKNLNLMKIIFKNFEFKLKDKIFDFLTPQELSGKVILI